MNRPWSKWRGTDGVTGRSRGHWEGRDAGEIPDPRNPAAVALSKLDASSKPRDVRHRCHETLTARIRARCLHMCVGGIEMASHTSERGSNAVKAHQVKGATASGAKSVADAVDDKKGNAADRIDDAADAVGEKGESAPAAAAPYARAAEERLHDAADYVRDTDARQMGRDAMDAATAHPVASLLLLSAVVIGGSFVVAALLKDGGPEGKAPDGRRPMGLASAAHGLGPKGTETLMRIRDAAFGFALARAVDTAEQLFPGFRDHYERG